MIDPPWVKPAAPTLRLGAPRDPLSDIVREFDRLVFQAASVLKPLAIPRLGRHPADPPIGVSET